MAKQSLFTQVQADAYLAGVSPRSREAQQWFKQKVKELGRVNRRDLLKDPKLTRTQKPVVGSMFMFFYDPKHREKLPYYDSFPLTIVVEPTKDGFYGINLHYLSPVVRARFLEKLMETASNQKFNDTTKLRISYQLLKSVKKYREFEPCFKRYLMTHVETPMVRVEPSEWEIAAFLPVEQFNKKNKTHVWGASKRSFRK